MKLLEKGKIGTMTTRNRVYMAPMGIPTDLDGGYTQRNIDYYAERAKGGAGLIFTAANLATDKFESRAGNLLNSMQHVDRLHRLAKELHFYDTKLCVQISAGLGRVGAADPFTPPYSSSATKSFWYSNLTCIPFSKEEIQELVVRIGYSATLAKQAGADCVELHAYGGYLLDQFQTSLWNLRDDEYGGDLNGRMRFTLECIAEIKKNCGTHFPLLVKFTPDHGIEGGRTIEEGIEIAKMLEKAGVDALHVDYGCYETWYNAIPTVYQTEATQIHLAKQIREAVSIPVLSQGKLGKPEVAEAALENGCADFVGLGHYMLADPYWVKKVEANMDYDIVPCIGCNECLRGGFAGIGSQCAVNPRCHFEKDYPLTACKEKKRVLVVGGGPGGVMAAVSAAQRGLEVELWEKNNVLGGNLLAAGAPSFKKDVLRYVDYMKNKIYRSNVTLRMSREATLENITEGAFDAVIIAAGSKPLIPPIQGIDSSNVKISSEVLIKKETGENCVVIGGGLVGCETALMIKKDLGKKVCIMEMQDTILATANDAPNNMMKLKAMLEEAEIPVICGAKVKEITNNNVSYEQAGELKKLSCDTVVIASGYKAENSLVEALEHSGIEIKVIGDSKIPGKVFEAVHEGYHAARMLFE